MDPEAAAEISPHLLAAEVLLWCGRPREMQPLYARIVIIVILAASAIAMRALSPDTRLGATAAETSIVIAVIVLALVVEGAVYHSFLTSTFYGVTNQRVIIVSGLRTREAEGFLLDRLNNPTLKIRRHLSMITIYAQDTEKMLRFGYLPFSNPSVPNTSVSGRDECYRLVGIEDAGRVYALILDAAHKLGDSEYR
jgi:hypothetical protein